MRVEYLCAIFLNEVVNETKEDNEYEKACPPGRGAAHYYLGLPEVAVLVPAGTGQPRQQDHRACQQYTRYGDSVGITWLFFRRRDVASRYVDVEGSWTCS